MIKLVPKRHAYHYPMSIGLIAMLTLAQGVVAQNKHKPIKASNKQGQRAVKRFEPERPITLTLKGCSVAPNVQVLNVNANRLEIDGERITLTDNAGNSVIGEVRAYSRSAYWLDANLGLIFGRMKVPFADASWKAPIIISVVLSQDRNNLRRLKLRRAEGLNPEFQVTTISCEGAEGSL